MTRRSRSVARCSALLVVVALVVAQFIPYPGHVSNPPFRAQPGWDTTQTWRLAARACFDCHSNQTTRPWYGHIAPLSWLVERDVVRARRALNFSEWDRPQPRATWAGEVVREWWMPPSRHLLLSGDALSTAERQALADGLDTTFGVPPEPPPSALIDARYPELGF